MTLLPLLAALSAGYGVFLLFTALALGWGGVGVGDRSAQRRRPRVRDWLRQAGLEDVRPLELAVAVAVVSTVAAGVGYAVFGGAVAPVAAAGFAATAPIAAARSRRRRRLALAREAWPRMIEEIRIAATSLGRSLPQALLDVGARGPAELRPAFAAAQREWQLSTDFERTLQVLKARLADATADAVCETLLVAHEMGGADVDRRLAALVEDRAADIRGRKDAAAKQAGARFARSFVLLVPLGMALVGLSIGDGRDAYSGAGGQAAVTAAVVLVALCWWWAGRLLRLPEPQRVFGDEQVGR